MARAPSNFREADVRRALRAIEAAGKKAESVVIEDGRIEIKLKGGRMAVDTHSDADSDNPWDAVDLK